MEIGGALFDGGLQEDIDVQGLLSIGSLVLGP